MIKVTVKFQHLKKRTALVRTTFPNSSNPAKQNCRRT